MDTRTDRSRSQILDAAQSAFDTLGFEKTTMAELAQRSGLTRKTVYNLFKSKEDVALSLIARGVADVAPLYASRMHAGEPALPLLQKIMTDSAAWCLANPTIAPLALAPRDRPSIMPPQGQASFQQIVRDAVALGQTQGVIRQDQPPEVLALILLGIYAQAMLTTLATGSQDISDIPQILSLVLEGIGV